MSTTTVTSIVETALERMADHLVLDQGRCVDVYLDLYGATEDVGLRWSIAERLDDIRYLSLVDAAQMRADLHAILAIATAPSFAVRSSSEPAVAIAA
jgi:hypothetical protein